MANEEHVAILKQGVEVWNKWRGENPEIKPDLSRGNLLGTKLSRAEFRKADLKYANLRKTSLKCANLEKADFSWADLNGANLSGARLHNAKLYGADLVNANLSGADLSGANLSEANLSEANLFDAKLSGANLSMANLKKLDLRGANLNGANLSMVKLVEANLFGASISGADLSKADLTATNLNYVDLDGANLSETQLMFATLVETNLKNANLNNCNIYGISAWDLKLENTAQTNLVITPPNTPEIQVDDIRVAQFIYLLLDHQELRNVLNTVTQKGVLILGRFGDGGIEVLQAIAQKLRELKYLPMIFDFDRPDNRDYTETVKTLAGLSRFVIVDMSGPSVPQGLDVKSESSNRSSRQEAGSVLRYIAAKMPVSGSRSKEQ